MEREGRNVKKKKIMAVGEARVAIFWPTPDFEGRTFDSSGFSKEGILCDRSTLLRERKPHYPKTLQR